MGRSYFITARNLEGKKNKVPSNRKLLNLWNARRVFGLDGNYFNTKNGQDGGESEGIREM